MLEMDYLFHIKVNLISYNIFIVGNSKGQSCFKKNYSRDGHARGFEFWYQIRILEPVAGFESWNQKTDSYLRTGFMNTNLLTEDPNLRTGYKKFRGVSGRPCPPLPVWVRPWMQKAML